MNRVTSTLRMAGVTGIALFLLGCVASEQYLDQGRRYIAAGDWDRGVRFYEEALEKYPGDTEIRVMLKGAKWRAAQTHLRQGQAYLKEGMYTEAIAEFQISLALDPTNRKVLRWIEDAKEMRKADFYINRGENYLKTEQHRQAREMFEKALGFDPDNAAALSYLRYFEKEEQDMSRYRLEIQNPGPISLKFKNTPVTNVFEVLSTLTGVNFVFDKDVQETQVTLFMTDVSFERFLEVLLGVSELAAKVVDRQTMIIYPDTPAKAKEYQDLQIRTFYLANMNALKVVEMLSNILKSKDIIANEQLNAVVIRAPADVVEVASRLIEANDRPDAEVLLNVEILEVSRTREQQLGLEVSPASVTLGLGEGDSSVNPDAVFVPSASVDALASLSTREMLVSVPTASLNFLKQDGDTRTLASPQIRVKNGMKSKILIGERVPLRTNRRIDTTGVVTFDFQYQEIGVKLDAMPLINLHGEITLNLRLEVSALGPNLGTREDPQFSIRTRTAESILTLFDGESVIIGGLISDEERDSMRKIPFLSDLPVLGRLFSNENTEDRRTDIIMAITPIITRAQEIPDIDIARIWSGSENQISVRTPYEALSAGEDRYLDQPRESIPLPVPEPAPPAVVTPPPAPEAGAIVPPAVPPPPVRRGGAVAPPPVPPVVTPLPEPEAAPAVPPVGMPPEDEEDDRVILPSLIIE